ncbi:SusD-like starch-binding protein associating with outer membrane [Anseongella ginsenosidimutans]|uniref:SusD-like starch-binding protein associating with outer membrane n=1 Tax=Anseongella ginsenosidimutans TaxID=496056 RepID=A0A4R3KSR7_9SPHI|nr:RagB/SusD family nutrient uptake outer membrane protein [Anseongella ginsenosidimutans]QEC52893.1 RagB/SusD family nutrient uptake outer membrane protein [Anseongella ginsenosidimutans]TCS87283.1 SusD-like starch-binding protein associating with outer membrane [Anseongella ginsenosidimutans]
MSTITIKQSLWAAFSIGTLFVCGCSDYLSVKPDQSLAVPNKLQDLQAILHYESHMIENYPSRGAYGADYYYLTDASWESLNEYGRAVYLWDQAAAGLDLYYYDWSSSYQRIFDCNVVLDNIEDVALGSLTEGDRERVKGSAYFFRGWTFYHLAQIFAPQYDPGIGADMFGIPLRLTSDINDPTVRSSLNDTYGRIIQDLKSAANLLPVGTAYPTQPSKPAVYGALAKVYLVMGDYELAAKYADSCLALRPDLVDYNTLDIEAEIPFEVFNEEVLLHTTISNSSAIFFPNYAVVDSNLYKAYAKDDLRKNLFFLQNDNGTYSFKGNYAANQYLLFNGIATDEIYLIRAEANVRAGNVPEARDDINKLLVNRWKTGNFEPVTTNDAEELLMRILEERRKELAFRGGIRWSDLRRLNTDPKFETSLTRRIMGKDYQLQPGDSRYTFHIPLDIIELTGIQQNE